jgi:hypothetical protein
VKKQGREGDFSQVARQVVQESTADSDVPEIEEGDERSESPPETEPKERSA